MFEGEAVARSALRREILHRRLGQPRVLPSDLSGAYGEGEELPVFPDGGGCC
jgi:hypothetical protein